MTIYLVTILLSIVFYLLPGLLISLALEIKNLRLAGRLFLSFCLSLVSVPFAFILVANVFPFVPNLTAYAILCTVLGAAAAGLRMAKKRPVVEFPEIAGQIGIIRTIETVGVWVFLAVFAVLINQPRMDMFLQGVQTLMIQPADETWHFAQLVSVARNGIPPTHYYFPSVKLAYYYATWIYPAILGNQPIVDISLARAMAIQAYAVVFAFLGLMYCLISYTVRRFWTRMIGLVSLTVAGGFDLYANWPELNLENWQTNVKWLESGFQISQFITTYIWVPQHLGAALAGAMGCLMLTQVKANRWIKIVFLAVFSGYAFSTSPFVFLSCAIAGGIYFLANWKTAWRERGKVIAQGLVFLVLVLVVAWYPLMVYSGHEGGLGWNEFRVPLLETLTTSPKAEAIDRVLTLLGFPVVAAWIGLIECGLPFVLYLAWLARRWRREPSPLDPALRVVLCVYPLLYFFLAFLITDYGGGGNFIMRGMIPVQVFFVLGGLYFLEEIDFSPERYSWRFWAAGYVMACFLAAQTVSAYELLQTTSLETKILVNKEAQKGRLFDADGKDDQPGQLPWPSQMLYIRWINQNTPKDAVIVESGCLKGQDSLYYRWLERSRFIRPGCSASLGLFERDRDFILMREWKALRASSEQYDDMLDFFEATDYRWKADRPVYIIAWNKEDYSQGTLVYEDKDVRVFLWNK